MQSRLVSDILEYGVNQGLIDLDKFNSLAFAEQMEAIRKIGQILDERESCLNSKPELHNTLNSRSNGEIISKAKFVLNETISWVNERKIRAIAEGSAFEGQWLSGVMDKLLSLIGDGVTGGNAHDVIEHCFELFASEESAPAYVTGDEIAKWDKGQKRIVRERQLYWLTMRKKNLESDFLRAKEQGFWD
jgi:hypothetical protein